ncbi:MAG: L-rhamnose mutarotase [Armatimonadota bacterium]|nr:L-rhamnose mutarotase [Armatimonadota bacterium]
MERVCFLHYVKPEFIEEYKRDHQAVDPEMLQALTEAGFTNYSLFLREDGLLVGYFEAEDTKESLRRVNATEANRIWQQKMLPYFKSGPGDEKKAAIDWLEQAFYLP